MICIIGAGISGLSTAYHLHRAGIDYMVLEAGSTAGGYISTDRSNGYILERGPNSLLMDEELFKFLQEIGLESEIEYASQINKKRYIYKDGRYQALPTNPLALLFSGFFSWRTKKNILRDLFGSSSSTSSIITSKSLTLHDFFSQKFGEEVVDYALQPFIAGIYSGDPKKLLTHLTFPSLLAYQKEYGSIIRGLIKNAGVRKKSITFRKGMQTLPDAMSKDLNIKFNVRVEDITCENECYTISTSQGNFKADKIVITTAAYAAGKYLRKILPETSANLLSIHYPPMAVVHSVYKASEVVNRLDGFGGLNPVKEKLFAAGSIFSSAIFAGRCAEDEVLYTTFVGGSLFEQVTSFSDSELLSNVQRELSSQFEIAGLPILQKVSRWERAIPQYDVNLEKVLVDIEALGAKGIFICANWNKGVSLGDCIKKGWETANNFYAPHPK